MILISKNTEPTSFTQYKASANAHFNDLPGTTKSALRKSLLEEQGFLCAYCMRHIEKDADIKIEHYEARNSDNELVYNNLLAVCKGNEGTKPEAQTCDTKKGETALHINPQNFGDMNSIYYDSQGKIYSEVSQYDKDLNDVLNLNYRYGYLIANRKAALDALKEKIRELPAGRDFKRYIERLYGHYAKIDGHGQYKEYVGILRWYLEKKR